MKKILFSALLLIGATDCINAAQIFIKTLTGETLTIDIDPDVTIEKIKQAINEKENIPVERQRIIFSGKEVIDPVPNLSQLLMREGPFLLLIKQDQTPIKGAGRLGQEGVYHQTPTEHERQQAIASAPIAPAPIASAPIAPAPIASAQVSKINQRITLGALAAAVIGAAGYITHKAYQNRKKALTKKYKLGNLTKLQDKIWLATIAARYGVTWRLHALVRNNPTASLSDFTGSDPRALSALYYGHTPSNRKVNTFIKTFFANVKQ